jgi:CRISPR/Cas system-associated exonuclease Cas4 (RecB family)
VKLSSGLAERTRAKKTPGVLLPAVKENMLKQYMVESDRRWDIIHPSELSHQKTFCPRAVYLRITEGPILVEGKNFNFSTENIFDEGHAIHAKWQQRFRTATPLWGDWKCIICDHIERDCLEPEGYDYVSPTKVRSSRPCDYRTGDDYNGGDDRGNHIWEYQEIRLDAEAEALMVGHADGGAWTTLAEIKSVGTGSVRIEAWDIFDAADGDLQKMWSGITRPFKTHVNQVDIYLWICQTRGLPFTSAEFIYESKWNQQVKNFTVEYSEERSTRLVDQAVKIKYAVEQRIEPACRFPGTCENCKPFDDRREVPLVRKRTARTTRT